MKLRISIDHMRKVGLDDATIAKVLAFSQRETVDRNREASRKRMQAYRDRQRQAENKS